MKPDAMPYKLPKQIVKNGWRITFLITQTKKTVDGFMEFIYL